LADLCGDLAFQVVKDGEGAEKVFRVLIRGAKSKVHADRVGRAVVNSPLVKTAVHGGDPNWGRIITAAGASGATIKPGRLSLSVGPKQEVCVFSKGEPCVLDGSMERRLERLMADELVVFSLDLGLGDGEAQWHGCDLSAEYVTINAEYTT